MPCATSRYVGPCVGRKDFNPPNSPTPYLHPTHISTHPTHPPTYPITTHPTHPPISLSTQTTPTPTLSYP